MIEKMFEYLMSYYQLIGGVVLILVLIFDREQLEVKLDGLAKFTGLMVLVMLAKVAMLQGNSAPDMYGLTLGHFKLVFLEDAFFVMIPFYINKKINSKFLRWAIWIFFSGLFASGHIYQGLMGMAITSIYPYFLSRRYAVKTTFGTVMACHFMYDCFQLLTVKLHVLLGLLAGLGV